MCDESATCQKRGIKPQQKINAFLSEDRMAVCSKAVVPQTALTHLKPRKM